MSRMYFLLGSPMVFVSGIGATRSPWSTTWMPSAVSRSPRPAIRNADGPMSTPRRLPPRSRDTPMMCMGRMERLGLLRPLTAAVFRHRLRTVPQRPAVDWCPKYQIVYDLRRRRQREPLAKELVMKRFDVGAR